MHLNIEFEDFYVNLITLQYIKSSYYFVMFYLLKII